MWQHGQRGVPGQPELPVLPRVPDGRKGAGRPAPVQAVEVSTAGRGSGVNSSADGEVVHRGVRWRRSQRGRISWFNDGLGQWVGWSPGSDAPPLPPGWGSRPQGGAVEEQDSPREQAGPPSPPADAMSARPSMRSPYRLVPLLVVAFIVAIALWQASRPAASASKADIAAAQALKDQCLARSGGTASAPIYSPTPVSCTAQNASVRVVAVLVPGSTDTPSCPRGSTVVQVVEPNVRGEPSECVLPVRKPGSHGRGTR